MPYRKRYTKSTKRYRKRRSRFNQKTGAGLNKSFPLSKKFTFKTRYVDVGKALDPAAGGIAVSQVYNLTSLFDPDTTGTGHQPIGFDQIMPMYDHYTVIGARARVELVNADETQPQLCLLQLKDTSVVSTNSAEVIENGVSRYTLLSPKGGSKDTATLTLNFSSKKFFGKSPMDGDKYQGTSTSNPAENCFLHIMVDPQTTSNVAFVKYIVTIEYIAIMTEPKQLTQS